MLYPVLSRMEKEQLIQSQWVKTESGRKRKYYEITKTGEERLERERQQWLRVNRVFAKLWGMSDAPYVPEQV
jgi:DNA-binding PadR family transcriptional regulator